MKRPSGVPRRPARVPSAHFLALDEALRVHETLTAIGYALDRRACVRRVLDDLIVRLVWRRADRTAALLSLRLRLPSV